MAAQRKMYDRILQHRLDAAKVFPNLGTGREKYSDFFQGMNVSREGIARRVAEVEKSLMER